MIRRTRPLATPTRSLNQRLSPAVGLVLQPEPGQLDGDPPRAPVAGLADALVLVDLAALPGARLQAEVGRDLAAVGEVAVEHLARQEVRRGRADPAQLGEQGRLLRGLAVPRGAPPPLELAQHPPPQRRPPALARVLRLEAVRQRPAVARPQGLEPIPPAAPGGLEVAHALGH